MQEHNPKSWWHIHNVYPIWATTIMAIIVSAIVNVVVLWLLQHVVKPFGPLHDGPVVMYTVLGAIGASIVYAILRAFSRRADQAFLIISLVVLIFSFIPDLRFLQQPMAHMAMTGMNGGMNHMAGSMNHMNGMSGSMPMSVVGSHRSSSNVGPFLALVLLHITAAISIVFSLVGMTKPHRRNEIM